MLSPVPPYPVKHPFAEVSLNDTQEISRDYNTSEEKEAMNNNAYGAGLKTAEDEFKSQLLSFTIDILLNDVDLVKNIAEGGKALLLHLKQLKQLIAILCLNKEERLNYEQLIDIETELITDTCLCKSYTNPFFVKVKSIAINKSVNFLLTPYATNMTSVFRISLEYVIKDS
jgi:hypothetical protein